MKTLLSWWSFYSYFAELFTGLYLSGTVYGARAVVTVTGEFEVIGHTPDSVFPLHITYTP